jgi:hypothetical protein
MGFFSAALPINRAVAPPNLAADVGRPAPFAPAPAAGSDERAFAGGRPMR